jgi:hypothetical protein
VFHMSKLSVHETEQENENAGSPTLQHDAAPASGVNAE